MAATTIIVNDESPRRQYTATGGQTVFDFPIPFFEQGDLTVYLTPVGQAADDAADLLVITTNYTVSGENTQDGGLVTLVVGATAGDIITIERVLDIERTADYQNSGDLLAETLNREQDSEIMISQQLREDIGRGLRFQATGTTQSATVPEPVSGRSLKWNPAADALINSDDDLDAIAAAAQASADASQASADASASSASDSANSATASDLSKDYATEWANKAEDSPVSVAAGGDGSTTFSALHHAAKAADSAASNNLPLITVADAGKGLEVNPAGDGYITTPLARTGYINGLGTSNSTDTDHDIDIATGVCADSTGSTFLSLDAGITKQIDANWAEGTGLGGFPSGLTLAANTTYHLFLIAKTDGTVDAGWDTSLTAANLLADATGYTLYRRIASLYTDASLNLVRYSQLGTEFLIDHVNDTSNANPGTAAVTLGLSVPSGVQVWGMFAFTVTTGALATDYLVSSLDQADTAPSATVLTGRLTSGGQLSQVNMKVRTNTSAQVRYRFDASDAGVVVRVATYGWTDNRGAF